MSLKAFGGSLVNFFGRQTRGEVLLGVALFTFIFAIALEAARLLLLVRALLW